MKTYRWSVRLKLGLIVGAGIIAVASLLYTQRLVDRLREREQALIQLWADAQVELVQAQQQAVNPHLGTFQELEEYLERLEQNPRAEVPPDAVLDRYQTAVTWAQTMPPTNEANFILNSIIQPNQFGIPAIITDSSGRHPRFWRNVGVPGTLTTPRTDSAEGLKRLRTRKREMAATFEPIPIRVELPSTGGPSVLEADRTFTQYLYYDESWLIRELRIFPWIQLLFVGLFIMVGYFGFSYIRRSEQSSLWMGMAREAAHQLGTPLSSLMGWIQILRTSDLDDEQREETLDEIENDVERLRRIADRFSDIGSQPKLKRQNLVPIIRQTATYLRRRLPHRGQDVDLIVEVPSSLEVAVNQELFVWVLENLLKNALDAIEDEEGTIRVTAGRTEEMVFVEVMDTGTGIRRHQWGNVFRPGFSTKQRGWGLGLSLARRVVQTYHGGTLELKSSTVGEGSVFRIELPGPNAPAESAADQS
ncbi:MAG: two-component sensor histidine kinase [Bacteroidetes bacterium SW_9_63_38]|nr:MAG: two-component sensor histidine kinase [Bacteroidetes bacterium SW_9_63_38]